MTNYRGAPRLGRGVPNGGGDGGHVGAPVCKRRAPRLYRGVPNGGGYGGHLGAPILNQ